MERKVEKGDSHIARTLSGSDAWFTPAIYLDLVREVFGGEIELDPASCEQANAIVRAKRYYSKQQDGLSQEWKARTFFLNPPYGRGVKHKSNQEIWSQKLIQEYESGHVEEAILLLNACTGTAYFQNLLNHGYHICLVRGRIHFDGNGKSMEGPTHDNAFIYLGKCPERFIQVFERIGPIVVNVKGKSMATLYDEYADLGALQDAGKPPTLIFDEKGLKRVHKLAEKYRDYEAKREYQQLYTNEFLRLYCEGQELEPDIRDDGLHVSDVLHQIKCWRQVIFKALYHADPIFHGAIKGMTFATGKEMHERLQRILTAAVLRRGWRVLGSELPHKETTWNLGFHPDWIGDWLHPGCNEPELTIIEFKGWGTKYWQEDDAALKPKREAEVQVMIYGWFLNMQRLLVAEIDKNTHAVHVYPVEYDEKVIAKHAQQFNKVKWYVEKHKEMLGLPKRLDVCKSITGEVPCSCPCRSVCFSTPEQRISMRRAEAWT